MSNRALHLLSPPHNAKQTQRRTFSPDTHQPLSQIFLPVAVRAGPPEAGPTVGQYEKAEGLKCREERLPA